ncbi:response regulator [Thalassotalea atypica]|uniref:response regulator n=1 Tax=Thalassotalea atypica TaxID=2054316 RepID=UPI0025746251|nr:response regulator [Thalassotalea atypica]
MKVLFVSDNHHDINLIKRIFARGSHQLTLSADAQEAEKLLISVCYDVIIAAEQQPVMSGSTLLNKVQHCCPNAIRILVAEQGIECKAAHQHFTTPLNPSFIIEVIESFARSNSAITKKQIVSAVAGIKTLPSPPKVYMQLNSMLKDETTDSQKIAEVIIQDPALVAKVLHFANSSAMSKGKQIKSIPDAITKMGLDTLCCIVMTAELFAYEPDIEGFNLTEEQVHSLSVAKLAASIVKPELKLDALLAGLLHDLGKIVLFEIDPKLTKQYFKLKFTSTDNSPLERKIFSTDHCQIGGYLLHQWSFPYSIIEAVVLHHSPDKLLRKSFGVAQAVYLANKLIKQQDINDKFIEHFKLDTVIEKLELRAKKLSMH